MKLAALPRGEAHFLTSAGVGELASHIKQAGIVAIAVDTSAVDVFRMKPQLLGFAVPTRAPVVLDLSRPAGLAPLANALRRAHAIVHGAAPARELLRLELEPAAFYDTKTALRLLDAGRAEGEGPFLLTSALERELGQDWVSTTALGAAPATVCNASARVARAALGTVMLAEIVDGKIHDASLAGVFKLECDLLPVLLQMQFDGLPIDRAAWAAYLDCQRTVAASLRASLLQGLGVRCLEDSGLVLAAVRERIGFVGNTKKQTLIPYIADPQIADLIEYRRANAFIKSPGEAVLHAISASIDGRVRADFRQIGAPTGRMSCASPNLMALPKDPAVRACIAPGDGRSLVVADLVAIELRVLADRIAEPRLRELFKQGGDPHQLTAALISRKSVDAVTKEERQKAKAINFGVVFGMGATTLVDYARGVHRIKLTLEEATAFREAFLENYKGVRDWHDETKRSCPSVVRTASGRMRHFGDDPSAFCARLNTPVQGTAADGLKRAMVLLPPRLKPFGANMVLSIHDELLVDTPTLASQEVMRVVVDGMREGMQEFVQTVPIVVDAEIRHTWARGGQ